jgi:predicted membrane-bound spermidine synthase
MALLGWIMLGIAIWHFTVFLPDRFWAGIVGAFLWSVLGAVASGLLFSGLALPSQDDTNLLTILEAVPGTVVGLAIAWWLGVRQERAAGAPLDAFGRTVRP